MSLNSAAARLSSIKVLWALVAVCGIRTLHAQPNPIAKTEAPLISMDEALQILDETSRVTLSFKDALPREVLAEFTRQTQVTARPQEFGRNLEVFDKPVSVELKDVPFWDAVKELEQQMQVSFSPQMMRGGFEVSPGAPPANRLTAPRKNPENPDARQLEFKHALGSMHIGQGSYSRQSHFGDRHTQVFEQLSMQFYAQLDPRLKLVALKRYPDIEVAVDEKGRTLLMPTKNIPRDEAMEAARFGGDAPHFYLQLKPNTGTRIAHLKGTVRVRIAAQSEAWEISDLTKAPQAKRITRLGVEQTLNFLKLRLEGREWHVDLLVQNEGLLRLHLPPGATSIGSLRLLNAQNREFLRAGSVGGGGDNDSRASFSFFTTVNQKADFGEPAKLIWMVPVEWKEIDIPFEFRNVPLP